MKWYWVKVMFTVQYLVTLILLGKIIWKQRVFNPKSKIRMDVIIDILKKYTSDNCLLLISMSLLFSNFACGQWSFNTKWICIFKILLIFNFWSWYLMDLVFMFDCLYCLNFLWNKSERVILQVYCIQIWK